jgi:hypothetical protein
VQPQQVLAQLVLARLALAQLVLARLALALLVLARLALARLALASLVQEHPTSLVLARLASLAQEHPASLEPERLDQRLAPQQDQPRDLQSDHPQDRPDPSSLARQRDPVLALRLARRRDLGPVRNWDPVLERRALPLHVA